MAALIAVLVMLTGCNYHYSQGLRLESLERWEEAAIEYRLAYVDDPDDPEFREALDRANKVVARENFERYRDYLAGKQFHKAYARLLDAASQDPDYEPVQAEFGKWLRVLVSGQIDFSFQSLRATISLADEIHLVVRINTPNPGQIVEAEIDIDTGIFFVEDLLYDPPDKLLTYYTVNAIGVSLIHGKTDRRRFSSSQFIRFVNLRSPVLDSVEGKFARVGVGALESVLKHRAEVQDPAETLPPWFPPVNPHYSLTFAGERIVTKSEQGRTDFTPRFLYRNRKDGRMFVDFGHYKIRQSEQNGRWGMTRLPVIENDYFRKLFQNIALKPYFFYHGDVFEYVRSDRG